MATWHEMSLDCLEAAKELFAESRLRSCVSRAYYAVYCAVAGEITMRKVKFPFGWKNPGHKQLPDLVLHKSGLPYQQRLIINKAVRRLRKAREDADYRPSTTLSRSEALKYLHDARLVVRQLVEVEKP